MWGVRYWGVRYWGARYWGKIGLTVVITGRAVRHIVLSEDRVYIVPEQVRRVLVESEYLVSKIV